MITEPEPVYCQEPGTFCSLLKLSSKETFIIEIVITVHKVENESTISGFCLFSTVQDSSSDKAKSVKKTRYVNLSKLHISSIFAIFLAFCFISATYFFKNFIISNFKTPISVILMTKIISNLQLKPKRIPS